MPLIFLPIKSELTSVLFDRWLVGGLAPTDKKVHVPKVFRSMELYTYVWMWGENVQTQSRTCISHFGVYFNQNKQNVHWYTEIDMLNSEEIRRQIVPRPHTNTSPRNQWWQIYQTGAFPIWSIFFDVIVWHFSCLANSQEIKAEKTKETEQTRCWMWLTILPKKKPQNFRIHSTGISYRNIVKRKFVIDKRMVVCLLPKNWITKPKPLKQHVVIACSSYLHPKNRAE